MYGGLSSYGGLGGYGSSYGGMSSYGSSYGGYGGLGSYASPYSSNSTAKTSNNDKQANQKGSNGQSNGQNKQPQIRKIFFQQWFKMMGGLRSIVQLGFAAIALANFWTKGKQIFMKFWQFSKQMAKSIGTNIQSKIPTKVFTDLASPKKRTSALKTIFMIVLRVLSVMILCLGFKMRRQIRQQNKRKQQYMTAQLQKINNGIQLVQQSQIQMKNQAQPSKQVANL